ncbi:MAG: hypothetical protein R3C20_12635 [Planctomycetaceae bacterium]
MVQPIYLAGHNIYGGTDDYLVRDAVDGSYLWSKPHTTSYFSLYSAVNIVTNGAENYVIGLGVANSTPDVFVWDTDGNALYSYDIGTGGFTAFYAELSANDVFYLQNLANQTLYKMSVDGTVLNSLGSINANQNIRSTSTHIYLQADNTIHKVALSDLTLVETKGFSAHGIFALDSSGTCYFHDGTNVKAVDDSGTTLWTRSLGYSSGQLDCNDDYVLATVGTTTYCLNPSDGSTVWSVSGLYLASGIGQLVGTDYWIGSNAAYEIYELSDGSIRFTIDTGGNPLTGMHTTYGSQSKGDWPAPGGGGITFTPDPATAATYATISIPVVLTPSAASVVASGVDPATLVGSLSANSGTFARGSWQGSAVGVFRGLV